MPASLGTFLRWCALLSERVPWLALIAWTDRGHGLHRVQTRGLRFERAQCDALIHMMLGRQARDLPAVPRAANRTARGRRLIVDRSPPLARSVP